MSDSTPVGERTYNDATILEHAAAAAEAIRAINHLTRGGPMPAPLVYDLLGELKVLVQRLPQALDQIANALTDSMLCYALTDAPGRDPEFSIVEAGTHLIDAASRAEKLGELLEAAQTAIRDQGYRPIDEN
ncbi:MAG: hypothetical protein ACT4QF_20520 [Sporichthyaceae bacterium]